MKFKVTEFFSKKTVIVRGINNVNKLKEVACHSIGYDEVTGNSIKLFSENDFRREMQHDEDLNISRDLVAIAPESESAQTYKTMVNNLESFGIEKIIAYAEIMRPETFAKVRDYVKNSEKRKTSISSRLEHPEWFEGIDSPKLKQIDTKEGYMKHLARSRSSNFVKRAENLLIKKLSQASDTLISEEKVVRENSIQTFKNEMTRRLSDMNYFECYFDRSYEVINDLHCRGNFCNKEGLFRCQGKYNSTSGCNTNPKHEINPYESYERRLLFSCWQLDHRKDLRDVADLIWREFVHSSKKTTNDTQNNKQEETLLNNAFEDLFTRENLSLVHKNCHVQTPHSATGTVMSSAGDDDRNP